MSTPQQYNPTTDETLMADNGLNTRQDYKGDIAEYKAVYPVFFAGSPSPVFRKGVTRQSTLEPTPQKFPAQGQ